MICKYYCYSFSTSLYRVIDGNVDYYGILKGKRQWKTAAKFLHRLQLDTYVETTREQYLEKNKYSPDLRGLLYEILYEGLDLE